MLITTQAAQPNPESFRSMLDDAVPPQSFRGNHCQDCGSPISRFSRGRCKLCGYIGLKREVPEIRPGTRQPDVGEAVMVIYTPIKALDGATMANPTHLGSWVA